MGSRIGSNHRFGLVVAVVIIIIFLLVTPFFSVTQILEIMGSFIVYFTIITFFIAGSQRFDSVLLVFVTEQD